MREEKGGRGRFWIRPGEASGGWTLGGGESSTSLPPRSVIGRSALHDDHRLSAMDYTVQTWVNIMFSRISKLISFAGLRTSGLSSDCAGLRVPTFGGGPAPERGVRRP